MKQITPSLLLTFMLCVLIGYFEPANAQGLTSSGSATANMVAYTTADNCTFWPNPVSPGVTITVTSADVPVGGFLVSAADGSQTPVSILATNLPVPGVVQTNQWFPVDVANDIYSNNASGSSLGSAPSLGSSPLSPSPAGGDSTLPDSSTLVSSTGSPFGPAPVVQTNQWFPVDASGNPITASLGVAQTNQWFPVDANGNPLGTDLGSVAQTNQWFPVDVFSGVANLPSTSLVSPTATTISLSPVPDGTYVLVIVGQSGNTYTSNIVISSM